MQNIKYQTGRTYNGAQVLDIHIHHLEEDDYGIVEIQATFNDQSRNISGKVTTLVFDGNIGKAILTEYDQGNYE